ncbi:hypothetical protein [Photobacterium sp. Hal280]|uniref:hypothetical protein n=1 Tax=Photobacterium sp. Hal280 TaxID=3035163 RepID=UPI00301BDB39
MAELSISRIYLMGRIHNIDGDVSRGSKLFAFMSRSFLEEIIGMVSLLITKTINQLVSKVKSGYPIAYSDQYGKLNIISDEIGNNIESTIVGSPIVVKPGACGSPHNFPNPQVCVRR